MTLPVKPIAIGCRLLAAVALAFSLCLELAFPNRSQRNAAPPKSGLTFEEVLPKRSGITWVHTNAHSPDRHLPETVGAGCAFFDFDNDGWMDFYLVNSGPSDFFTPTTPLKNALYHNNHGTF